MTRFAVIQKGGIRYQRKPYIVTIKDTKVEADIVASTITNAIVVPFLDETYASVLDTLVPMAGALSRSSQGSFGAASTSWDTPQLHCDTLGGFQLFLDIFVATTAAHTIKLRVNKSPLNITWMGLAGSPQTASATGAGTANLGIVNSANGIVGAYLRASIECKNPFSLGGIPPQFNVDVVSLYDSGVGVPGIALNNNIVFTYFGGGEVDYVGVEDSVALGMLGASRFVLNRTGLVP